MPSGVSVSASRPAEVSLVVTAAAGGNTKASQEAAAALKKVFEEGVAASNAGKHDEAIAKFQQGITQNSNCADCYNNIGYSYTQMKDYDKAEAAYKKATEIRPTDAAAFNGLANVYNAQRKFDLAAQASAKATELSGGGGGLAGGGNADALYNQGVILWNGGKVAEAQKAFSDAVAANPNHAEAHYQLGMALVNQGKLAEAAGEFETYLKIAPEGPNAATAKGLLDPAQEVVLDSAALRARLDDVRDRIARAAGRAGRDPAAIRLIAVSKTFSADHVRAAAAAGQIDFGENKVQEGQKKIADDGRSRAPLASHRPPAVQQGPQGGRLVSRDSLDR